MVAVPTNEFSPNEMRHKRNTRQVFRMQKKKTIEIILSSSLLLSFQRTFGTNGFRVRSLYVYLNIIIIIIWACAANLSSSFALNFFFFHVVAMPCTFPFCFFQRKNFIATATQLNSCCRYSIINKTEIFFN